MRLEESEIEAPRLGEPFLLTPGPLTTSYDTKSAMLKTGAVGMAIFGK